METCEMKNQRDAVLGYANEQHAYYIRLIENDAVLGESYGLFCENPESEAAESEAPEAAESEAESEGENDSEGEGECGGESSGGGEGEGEGSASGQGCFPEFANLEEFETYIQGAYYSSIWSKPSNTVGIILSVLFWVALGCMGVYLGRK